MLSDSLSAYCGLLAKDVVMYEKEEDYDPEMMKQIKRRLSELKTIGELLDAGYGDWEEMREVMDQEISEEQIKKDIETIASFHEEDKDE